MSVLALPSSPNWYCSRAIDFSEGGIIAFASRHNVVLMRLQQDGYRQSSSLFYLGSLNVHKERIAALAFSPFAGQTSSLVTVADDQQVALTDVLSAITVVLHREHTSKPTCVCWTRRFDDDLAIHVVSGDGNGQLISVNVASKKTRCWRPSRGAITDVSSSRQQPHLVAVGYQSGLIVVIDLQNDGAVTCSLRHHDADVQSVCWAPFDGTGPLKGILPDSDQSERLLASSSRDRTVRVWSVQNASPILTLSVPSSINAPQRRQKNDHTWVTVAWPNARPDILLTSSPSGAMLCWDLKSTVRNPWSLFGDQKVDRQHSRAVFNVVCRNDLACTISMDRQVNIWQISDGHQLLSLSTLGGFAYCLTFSPVNSGVLAIGCGDCVLRTWNLTTAGNSFDIATFWQGIKSKVTAIAWHPKKEAMVAYGTEEGRVGICNVLSSKPPIIFPRSHRHMVYRVSWGPACPTQGMGDEPVILHLYSCGDGRIYVHDPQTADKMAGDLNDLLKPMDGGTQTTKLPNRTDISWNADFTILTVGNSNGSVEVYTASTLRLVAVISSHSRLLQCLRWHPQFTLDSSVPSPFRYWLAVASQDPSIHVHDLTTVMSEPAACHYIVTCDIQLVGHGAPVTSVVWSPHLDGHLVSASFDHTVRVWNVAERTVMACFCGHSSRVLSAEWSPLNPNVIVSGGEDYTVQMWKVSEQEAKPSAKVAKEIEKMQLKCVRRAKKVTTALTCGDGSKDDPKAEIERLLLERKQELLAQAELIEQTASTDQTKPDTTTSEEEVVGRVQSNGDITPEPGTEVSPVVSHPGPEPRNAKNGSQQVTKKKKPKKKSGAKSMFPLSSALENRGKTFNLEDCITLVDSFANGSRSVPTSLDFGVGTCANLGMYGGRVDAYKLLKTEGEHHLTNDNLDYALQLEVWKGNIAGALKMAAEKEQLCDWLVSLAVAVSPSFWSEMCGLYARQLVSDGQPHKAVLYLLADHKVHDAAEVLKTHVSYKEAVILAKVRLPPKDPLITQLMVGWAEQLQNEGNVEGAAKCLLAAGQTEHAASILGRKREAPSSRVGAYIADKLGTDPDVSRSYTDHCMRGCLVSEDYETAEKLIAEHPDLKMYKLVMRVLRCLHETWREWIVSGVDLPAMLDVVKQMLGHEESDLCDGQELDWDKARHRLFSCQFVPAPQTGNEVMAWLAILMVTLVLYQQSDDLSSAQQLILDAYTVVHKSADVSRFVWLDGILHIDLSTLEKTEQSVAIRAYVAVARLHALVRQLSENQMVDNDLCPCAKMFTEVELLLDDLLRGDLAEFTRLKTRLSYTKVALAAAIARAKGNVEVDTGASGVVIGLVPADRLIEHPGITVDALRLECGYLDDLLATASAKLQVRQFPDPFESVLLLADLCTSHLRDECRCPRWGHLLRTVVNFGHGCVALQRQTEKLASYEAILEVKVEAGAEPLDDDHLTSSQPRRQTEHVAATPVILSEVTS